jgi:Mrp family chromosome partitioning ATPase
VPLILALAVLAALPCGTGAALLRAEMDGGIANRPEAEAATGIPALALLPEVPPLTRARSPADLVLTRPGGMFAESVQRLAANLAYARPDRRPTRIMVTGADTSEGKSTLALALARLLARRGESVLLVEADLRRPHLRRTLGLRGRTGLAEMLRGEAGPEAAIGLDPRGPLHVLPAGRAAQTRRPGEDVAALLAGERLPILLDACARHYDRVVIDAPPVLLVHDALRMGALADVAVLALRWGRTRPATAGRAVAELARAGIDVAGLALTRIDSRRYPHDGAGDEVAYGAKARAYYGGA